MEDFHKASSQTLEELAEFFETWPQAEVDLLEESLTITLPKKHQYLINKHGVTRQIWLSSPFTGAHHFQLKKNQWRCTRTDILLEDLLIEERKIHVA
ncbi:MAG: iron donor protein CyaY [Alphaproteobacteria bacterium 41-28]|nr:MAG: iron donor protein CyaY [Alphaproteobacteria bacterium 41-28]